MYLEYTEDELVLRTINSNKSAFGEFRMCRSFFSSFNTPSSQTVDTSCKVTMKSCISVFKNAHGMDKQVENCEIRVKPENTQVIFQIKYVTSSVKKHYLPIIEHDQLEAQIPTGAPNELSASSRFLAAALKNFRLTEDEVSLAVSREKTVIKNHLELRTDAHLMRTELSFKQTDFESYEVSNPTSVTFCLKEMRAVVSFAEPANLPILISFTQPGRPVVFQVQNHPAYEANYVVSTLQGSSLKRSSQLSSSKAKDSIEERQKGGFSFVEEEPLRETFAQRKRPVETAGSRQTDISKSIRLHFDLPDSPQPCSSKQSLTDHYTSVVPESEPSLPLTQSSVASVCRVDTVIQGVHTSSQPSQELLKTVFYRCFSKDHFLNALVGHDVVLEESSDREFV